MKIYKLLNVCILALLPLSGFAQSNVIKTGISGIALGDFNLGYEILTTEKQSFLFKIGYFKPTSSPFITELDIEPGEFKIQKAHGGIQTSAEYRFYTGNKKALSGFYLGPYFRYFNVSNEYIDIIQDKDFYVDAKVQSIGAGVQLGYQAQIGRFLMVDFSFFGAGIDKHNLEMVYTSSITNFDFNLIEPYVTDYFSDVEYFQKRLKNQVNKDNLTSKLPFLFPGLRASLSVGVVF